MSLDDLLHKHLKGQLTPEEEAEFQKILAEGQHDEALKDVFLNTAQTYVDQGEPANQAPAAAQARTLRMQQALRSRIEAEVAVAPVNTNNVMLWRWLSGVAATLIIGASAYLFYAPATSTDTRSPIAHERISFVGPRAVTLPDHSKVILNAGATLAYDPGFGEVTRQVTLEGEAFFDVTHDPAHKFIVQTGSVTTTVLGTAFNIRQTTGKTVVTVTRGKVQVADTNDHQDIITPNQEIAVAPETGDFTKRDVTAEQALSWKSDFIIYESATMRNVATDLEKRFGVIITFATPAFQDCEVDAAFVRHESLDDVLAVLSATFNGEYFINGGNVKLSGSCQ